MGEAPDAHPPGRERRGRRRERIAVPGPERVAFAVPDDVVGADETGVDRWPPCRRRFPAAGVGPKTGEDLCYATTNRQAAVKALRPPQAPLVLVIGSPNSSNSQRLVETARRAGAAAELIRGRRADRPRLGSAPVPAVGVTRGRQRARGPSPSAWSQLVPRAGPGRRWRSSALLRESIHFMLPRTAPCAVISLRAVRPFDCDVAVVGAGPAGASAAAHLSRAGMRVWLLDQKPFPATRCAATSSAP